MLASNSENLSRGALPESFSAALESGNGSEHVPGTLMANFLDIGGFLRSLQVQVRFGRFSRAPLRLLRFELHGQVAECDWIARHADRWDQQLARRMRERNEAAQALVDAIAIRNLIFCALPSVNVASLRVFREAAEIAQEMIIHGTVSREQPPPRSVHSLVMRAKLCGLQFVLEDGVMMPVEAEVCAMDF
jgi:hypothetical protein